MESVRIGGLRTLRLSGSSRSVGCQRSTTSVVALLRVRKKRGSCRVACRRLRHLAGLGAEWSDQEHISAGIRTPRCSGLPDQERKRGSGDVIALTPSSDGAASRAGADVCMDGEPCHRRDLSGAATANQDGEGAGLRFWVQRQWMDAAPRFAVAAAQRAGHAAFPCQSCEQRRVVFIDSQRSRECWRGSRSSDLRSEAKRKICICCQRGRLDSWPGRHALDSHVGAGHWASSALAGPGRAPPKHGSFVKNHGLRMTALVLRRGCACRTSCRGESHQLTGWETATGSTETTASVLQVSV